MKIENKQQAADLLKEAGINITLSRTTGHNLFNLIYESYKYFVVNATANTPIELVNAFTKKFDNITILIDT